MGNSKIVYYGETLIDLTGDTVEAAKLRKGITAHDKKGEKITGTLADVAQATPAITVDAAGKITASATQAAGVVAAGTKSATKQLTVQAAKTVTPSASAQTAVAKGVFTTGIITVAAVYAVIDVTYPIGSTCTCTNGSTTLTAEYATGKEMFIIPAAGTWTVKAVSGSKSASKTVKITAKGTVATVTLAYEFILLDSTGWASKYANNIDYLNVALTPGTGLVSTFNSNGNTLCSKVVIDEVPNFNTLQFVYSGISSAVSIATKMGLNSKSTILGLDVDIAHASVDAGSGTATVDISGVNSPSYLRIAGAFDGTISEIRLR